MEEIWNAALTQALDAIKEEKRKTPYRAPIDLRAVGYMVMLESLQKDLGVADEWLDAIIQASQ